MAKAMRYRNQTTDFDGMANVTPNETRLTIFSYDS